MADEMTKAKLLDTMQAKRSEWEALLAEVGEERMTRAGAAGDWSVRDVIAHLTAYQRWMTDRLEEMLRGETYTPTDTDRLHYEERNKIYHEQSRDLSLQEVLDEDQQTWQRLLEAVRAHSEESLTEPHHFEGAPQPVIVWKYLRSEVYDHYGEHIPSIRAWLDAQGN